MFQNENKSYCEGNFKLRTTKINEYSNINKIMDRAKEILMVTDAFGPNS
jgi:hypothetical protein